MFEEVHRELLSVLDPRRPKDSWRRIFEYSWYHSEEHVGYVIVNQGELVGFMGTIFSEVVVEGKVHRVCNVTSLIAKEAHRTEAFALVLSLRNLKDYTLTNLSCNELAYPIFDRIGFETLETHASIFSPLRRGVPTRQVQRSRVSLDPANIKTVLEGPDLSFFEDHLPYTKHLVTWDSSGYCYVVYTLGRRFRLRTARLHYVSDRERFASSLPMIQRSLLCRHGTVLAECDSRLVASLDIPSSYQKELPIPRLFLSPSLTKDQINNLYSELVLLDIA
jgi:hypothetical protein